MDTLINSWMKGFGLMCIPIILGVMSGKTAKSWLGVSHNGTTYLQWAGMAFLLWATLGIAGWEIQTFGDSTPPEILNRWIYRTLHCLGTYLLAFSVTWPTVDKSG